MVLIAIADFVQGASGLSPMLLVIAIKMPSAPLKLPSGDEYGERNAA